MTTLGNIDKGGSVIPKYISGALMGALGSKRERVGGRGKEFAY